MIDRPYPCWAILFFQVLLVVIAGYLFFDKLWPWFRNLNNSLPAGIP